MAPFQTKTTKRSMAQNTFLNLMGQLVPMLIGLFSIPLLIKHIGMDRFGLLSLVWVVIGYFTFFDLGLGRAIIKLVAEKIGDRREEEIPRIFWNALLIMTSMSVIGSAVVFWLTPILVVSVFKIPDALHDEAIKAFYGLSLSLILVTLTAGFRGILEARQRFDFANFLHILMGASTFVGPLIISYWTQDLFILVLVLLVVRFFIFLAHLWFVFLLYPELRSPARIERATLRRLFKFATWMTVSNVISPIMVYFDRFILGAIVPVSYLAFYTTPYEIVNRLLVVPAAVVRTIFPTFALMGVERSKSVESIFVRCVKWLAFVLFPTILIIVYFGQYGLKIWLGDEFARESTRVLQVLSIGIFLNGIAFIPTTLLQSAERPDLTAKMHLLEFPFYLPSVWFMATRFGILGAAFAWTIRVSVDMFLLFGAVRWILPSLGRELGRLLIPLFLFMLFFIPAFFDLALADRMVLALVFLTVFVAVFWAVILRLEDRLMVFRRVGIEPVKPSGYRVESGIKRTGGVWAVTVTFNPEPDVVANILSYADQVDRVIVIDNGSSSESAAVFEGLQHPRIEFLSMDLNVGIAAALNRGCARAHQAGAEWVITFDQDTRVGRQYVREMLDAYAQWPRQEQVAVLAPSYYDETGDRVYRANGAPGDAVREVKTAFTSGVFIKLDVIEQAGLFEEKLFIDYVDHDFALRVLGMGYSILEARDVLCNHRLGKMRVHSTVGGKTFTSTHHAPVRRYYMSRNRLVLYRRFFVIEPLWVLNDIKAMFKELVKILLVEEQKIRKLAHIVRGLLHGLSFSPDRGEVVQRREGPEPRIGIVLATYNPPLHLLREQLRSIRAQTDQEWICVINDDNSVEECRARIVQLAQTILGTDQSGNPKFIFRQNTGVPGVVGNFADGLKALPPDCRLVCFCDQDDLWTPDKLSTLRDAFDDPRVSLAHSDMRLIDEVGREIFPSCWAFEGRDVNRVDPASLILRNSVSGCAMMFRREVLEFCLPFPEQPLQKPWFYHDVWIALGACFYGEIRAVSKPLVGYRQHGRNVVGAEPGILGSRSNASNSQQQKRSHWSVQKLETAWRSRSFLENAYLDRYSDWLLRHAGRLPKASADIRPRRIFSNTWDFGLRSFWMAFKVMMRSPRYIAIAMPIAFGKFFSDCHRLFVRAERSAEVGKLP